jgi:hypothetical protein
MKKLALIVSIAAISIVMLAVTASADGAGWINFAGEYEMSASGSCIHSQNNFTITTTGKYIANPGVIYAGTTASNGTWTFKKDGTGTYSYYMYATVTPPVLQPTVNDPISGEVRIFSNNNLAFTYEIDPLGDITVDVTEYGQIDRLYGSISVDKKSITLFDVPRIKGPGTYPLYKIVCTASRTLIKVRDNGEE